MTGGVAERLQRTEASCGTVPYTVKDGTVYYLLIQTPYSGTCGFPKGHREPGETEQQTALRETWEETSVRVTLVSDFRMEISYPLSNGNRKTVVFFLSHFDAAQAPSHNEGFEKLTYLVCPFDEAYRRLTFDNTKRVLAAAHAHLMRTLGA